MLGNIAFGYHPNSPIAMRVLLRCYIENCLIRQIICTTCNTSTGLNLAMNRMLMVTIHDNTLARRHVCHGHTSHQRLFAFGQVLGERLKDSWEV